MSIGDKTVNCFSCGAMLVLSSYNTNICPTCGASYGERIIVQAFTELLIREQRLTFLGTEIAEDMSKYPLNTDDEGF